MVIVVILTALVFDFTNGFHDSANAMATAVSTGAYKPKRAVLLAAIMNLVGACLSTEVAKTISSGIVDDRLVSPETVFAALVGAILWNLFTWLLGLPSSSSHAMFGALIGAVLVQAGMAGVHGWVIVSKILLPALVAPFVAGLASYLSTRLAYGTKCTAYKGAKKRFRRAQQASSLLVALAHGTSDGQKTMGIITLVLVAASLQPGYENYWWSQAPGSGPHWWVIGGAGLAIALGTYSGGWRIMRTMGKGMADIEPAQGFAAETSAMAAILASSHFGFGLSTTHVVSGAVMGTGLARTPREVRWGTAGRMGIGWLMTLPAAAAIGAGAALLAHEGTWGFVTVLVILAAAAGSIRYLAARNHVSSDNVNDDHVVRVFGKATEAPATPPTQGALATPLASSLPKGITAEHPAAATPLALTRLKKPKKKLAVPANQDPLPTLGDADVAATNAPGGSARGPALVKRGGGRAKALEPGAAAPTLATPPAGTTQAAKAAGSHHAPKAPESGRSAKAAESSRSAKAAESSRSEKAAESIRSAKAPESSRSAKAPESSRSAKAPESSRSAKAALTGRSAKAAVSATSGTSAVSASEPAVDRDDDPARLNLASAIDVPVEAGVPVEEPV
jgi:PiT family inorganic phosphate transporter